MKDHSDPSRDQVSWKWTRGAATDLSELGDPQLGSTRYTLCVYDSTAGDAALSFLLSIPAAADCETSTCWKATSRGWRFMQKTNGRLSVKLVSGAEGRSSIAVKASGGDLQLPPPFSATQLFANDAAMVVQIVRNDGGACWGSNFAAPAASHEADHFKDQLP